MSVKAEYSAEASPLIQFANRLILVHEKETEAYLQSYLDTSDCTPEECSNFWKAWKTSARSSRAFGAEMIHSKTFSKDLVKNLSAMYEDIIKLGMSLEKNAAHISVDSERRNDLVEAVTSHAKNMLKIQHLQNSIDLLVEHCASEDSSTVEQHTFVPKKRIGNAGIAWSAKKPERTHGRRYVPLAILSGGAVDMKYGESVVKEKHGHISHPEKFVGLRVLCRDTDTVSLFWEAYGFLQGMQSDISLFPATGGVCRRDVQGDGHQPSVTFTMENPDAVCLDNLIGQTLARSLRKNSQFIVKWCSQLSRAYRELLRLDAYELHTPSLGDVFVREDGSLIIGNILVSSRSTRSYRKRCEHDRDIGFVRFMCSVLSSALDTSRSVSVNLKQKCHGQPGIDYNDADEEVHFHIAEGSAVLVVLDTGLRCTKPPCVHLVKKNVVDSVADGQDGQITEEASGVVDVGDFLLKYAHVDDVVVTPFLLDKDSTGGCVCRASTLIRKDGNIYMKVHGNCAGSARFVLERICEGNSLTIITVHVHVTSYDVCSDPDVEELISLLNCSYVGETPPWTSSRDNECRVLGSKLLTKQHCVHTADSTDMSLQWRNVLTAVIMGDTSADLPQREEINKHEGNDDGSGAYLTSTARHNRKSH